MSVHISQDRKITDQRVLELGSQGQTEEIPTRHDGFNSNYHDKMNMERMGKQQEMTRVFKQASLVSFTAILMGTWQWMLLANSQALVAGGRAGLFWSYVS